MGILTQLVKRTRLMISLFYVRISGMPDFPFELSSLLGIAAKITGLLLVLWWISMREGNIRVKEELVSPTLI